LANFPFNLKDKAALYEGVWLVVGWAEEVKVSTCDVNYTRSFPFFSLQYFAANLDRGEEKSKQEGSCDAEIHVAFDASLWPWLWKR
jgi:hypothetical protein